MEIPAMCRTWNSLARLCVTVATLAGCSDSSDPEPGGPSDEQTTAIGAFTRDEVEAALEGMSLPTTLSPLGTGQASTPCVTGTPATHSDGDGVPDDATYGFTAPPCRFEFRGGTLDIIGQLRIQDPAPTVAGFGYEATIVALRNTFSGDDATPAYSITRNGTRSLSGSVAALQLVTDLQVSRTFTGQQDAAVEQQWTASYTPETSLQINQPLPSGTLELAGTLGWTRGLESITLTVTTPTPLHYNSGCTDTSQPIDAGELQAAGDFAETSGYVRLRWSQCDREPEVRFVESTQ
jgi:hypothetical protein